MNEKSVKQLTEIAGVLLAYAAMTFSIVFPAALAICFAIYIIF